MASLGTKMYGIKTPSGAPVSGSSTNGYLTPPEARMKPTLISLQRTLFVFLDVFSIWAGALFALGVRFPSRNTVASPSTEAGIPEHMAFMLLYSGLVVLFANTQRVYSTAFVHSIKQDAFRLLKATVMATCLLTVFIYLSGNHMISRMVVLSTIVVGFLGMVGWRYLRRMWMWNASADGLTRHNALIIGTDETARAVYDHLEAHRELGLAVKGFVTTFDDMPATGLPRPLGTLDDLETVSRANFIDELIVCSSNREVVKSLITRARQSGIGLRIVPDLYDGLACGAPVDYLGEIPSIHLHCRQIPAVALLAKRAIDMLLAGSALLVLAPVFAALAIAVKIDSPGSVFYVSRRVGLKGRIFSCYKFRTMVSDAERQKALLQHLNERDGILFKISNDPRITKLGRVLRKYSLDELAQLWNVFRGDMSLVGPRPPLANEVEQYQLDHLRRLEVAPGITGLWQVEARTSPSFDRYIELDLSYVNNWNLLLDLKIVLRTIAVVFSGTGQ